jgi:hypothetical protein
MRRFKMKKFAAIGALATLAACGVSEEKFQDQYVAAYCENIVTTCADDASLVLFETEDDCSTFISAFYTAAADLEGCEYDKAAAKECLDAADAADCDSWMAGGPAECATVYGSTCGGTTSTTGGTTMTMTTTATGS